jgi:hypothetical protein
VPAYFRGLIINAIGKNEAVRILEYKRRELE